MTTNHLSQGELRSSHEGKTWLVIGKGYKDERSAVKESIANALDAGATRIVLIKRQGELIQLDNGHGFTTVGDLNTLRRKEPGIAKGLDAYRRAQEDNNEEMVAELYKRFQPWICSGEFMFDNIVNSSKVGLRQQGNEGVGAIGWIHFAEFCIVDSKPRIDLVKRLVGSTTIEDRHVPRIRITFPTCTQLAKNYTRYTIDRLDEEIKDEGLISFKNGGTRMVFGGLSPEADKALSPYALRRLIRDEFSLYLTDNKRIIEVVDEKGEVKQVTPEPLEGVLLVKTTVYIANKWPCQVYLLYNPKVRGSGVRLLRRWALKAKFMDLLGFSDDEEIAKILDHVVGYIEYVDDPQAQWNSQKDTPLQKGPIHHAWVQRMEEFIKNDVLKAVLAKRRDLGSADIARVKKAFQESFLESLPEVDLFRNTTAAIRQLDNLKEVAKRGPRGKSTGITIPQPLTTVTVKVVGPIGIGLADIEIRLERPGTKIPIEIAYTNSSGHFSFGNMEMGLYRLSIVPPRGLTVDPSTPYTFQLYRGRGGVPDLLGFRAKFWLTAGDELQQTDIRGAIDPIFEYWDDPDDPWHIDEMDRYKVRLNQNVAELFEALENRDAALLAGIVAQWSTAGLLSLQMRLRKLQEQKGYEHLNDINKLLQFAMKQQSLFFAKVYKRFLDKLEIKVSFKTK